MGLRHSGQGRKSMFIHAHAPNRETLPLISTPQKGKRTERKQVTRPIRIVRYNFLISRVYQLITF